MTETPDPVMDTEGGSMQLPPDAATLTTLVLGTAKLITAEPSRARDLALLRTSLLAARTFGSENAMAVYYTAMSIVDLAQNSDSKLLDSETANSLQQVLLEAAEIEIKEVYERKNSDPRQQALDRFLIATEVADEASNVTEVAAFDKFVSSEGEPA